MSTLTSSDRASRNSIRRSEGLREAFLFRLSQADSVTRAPAARLRMPARIVIADFASRADAGCCAFNESRRDVYASASRRRTHPPFAPGSGVLSRLGDTPDTLEARLRKVIPPRSSPLLPHTILSLLGKR